MAVETLASAPGFREVIFNFLWYTVELAYMLAVIVYVGYTLDLPRGFGNRGRTIGEEIPAAAVGSSWTNATSFLKDAAGVARQLKETLNAPPEKPAEPTK